MIRTAKESLALQIEAAYSPDINMAWKRANELAKKYGVTVRNQRTVNTFGWPDLDRLKADIEAKLE